jgi:hypothetical protein
VVSVQDIVFSLESRKSEGITKDWNHLTLFRPASEEHRAAMRLEGWRQATTFQAAILRDARKSALLRMRSVGANF